MPRPKKTEQAVVPAEMRDHRGNPRTPKGGHPPRVDVIDVVRDLWKKRTPSHRIRRLVAEQCGITEDTALDYIRRVRAEYAPHTPEQRDDEIQQHLLKLEAEALEFERLADEAEQLAEQADDDVYNAVLARKEARECRKQARETRSEIAKMRGLYAPKKHDVNVTTSGVLVVAGGSGSTAEQWAAEHGSAPTVTSTPALQPGAVTSTAAAERKP